jgi:glutathione peroxidase-family protein
MKRTIKTKIRSEIAHYLWEKYKSHFSMSELAHILGWNTVSFFRNLKRAKNTENKEENKQ